MNRISVKLALVFITIILMSTLLSFVTSAMFMPNLQHEIMETQEAIGELIIELSDGTGLTSHQVAEIASWHTYEADLIENMDDTDLSQEEIASLREGLMVSVPSRSFRGISTYLYVGDDIFRIQLNASHNIWKMVASRIWFSGSLFVLIGSILIVFVVRYSVKPIIKLTKGTREIADGNFDVIIDHDGKDEIGQLTKHFNKMAYELKQKDTLRKDFVSNVSHELKTPLGSIQGYARLLQKEGLSDKDKNAFATIILEESIRLSNLTNNMLKLSRLEDQEIIRKRERFYLDEQIRKSVLLLESEWKGKDIEWDIELDKAMIMGDEELLQQVWINLIGNSIKFSRDRGTIRIRLNHIEDQVKVTIQDFGIGMSEDTRIRVFEKFYQGEEAHGIEGSGLGLPLVKRILDLHGSKIEVVSEPDRGTVYEVFVTAF